eukprot:4915455-Amphidinium_carterae.1
MEASGCPFARQLANTSVAKAAKEAGVAAVLESTHEQLDGFCTNTQCMPLMREFSTAYAQCYGRSICAVLAHGDIIEYEDCKPIMTSFVDTHTATQLRSSCSLYNGIYCTEEQTGLLLKDPLCYSALFTPVTGKEECEAHADCVSMWKGAQQVYPQCSRVIAHNAHFSMQSSLRMMKALYAKAKNPAMREAAEEMPTSMPLFMETCKGDVTINV